MSRCYLSVNARDPEKTNKSFLHWLIDHLDENPVKFTAKLAAHAANKDNRAENKWLFDYDDSPEKLNDFLEQVKALGPNDMTIEVHKTPNGHAVIVDKRFDTRDLVKNFNVELKRDDLLCVMWMTHE